MTVIRNIMLLVFTAALGVVVLGGTSLYLAGEINTSASYANTNTVPSLLEIDRAAAAFTDLHTQEWQRLNDSEKTSCPAMHRTWHRTSARLAKPWITMRPHWSPTTMTQHC